MALFPTSRVICNKTDIYVREAHDDSNVSSGGFANMTQIIIIVLEVIILAALINSLI